MRNYLVSSDASEPLLRSNSSDDDNNTNYTSGATILEEKSQYSALTGLIYVFNVIVGTGALAIPGVVATSGYVLSSFVLVILAFISYITVTFVIESMAISNAILLNTKKCSSSRDLTNDDDDDDPLLSSSDNSVNNSDGGHSYNINQRVEMGHMARLYFGTPGLYTFYACIVIYLYGDLSIYITAVSKSLRDVVCIQANSTTNVTDYSPCFDFFEPNLDRLGAYRLFTVIFISVVGPFAFANISKTKYIQMLTTFFRWSAFILMIVLALRTVITQGGKVDPVKVNWPYLPSLFGVSIYSFMCHHSLPSLVTPIKNKNSLNTLFALDYSLIALFYILLSVTGSFAFENIKDLYTLNFIDFGIFSYFLALFPVFTLSSNFPIIAITLKNNLKSLFGYNDSGSWVGNVLFTLCAIMPPFLVSVFIEDVSVLVNITGSFAGAGIQYVVPVVLCYCARRQVSSRFGNNPFQSPFKSLIWMGLVLLWTVVCVILVTLHLIYVK